MYGLKKWLVGKSRSLVVVKCNAVPERSEHEFEIVVKKLQWFFK